MYSGVPRDLSFHFSNTQTNWLKQDWNKFFLNDIRSLSCFTLHIFFNVLDRFHQSPNVPVSYLLYIK